MDSSIRNCNSDCWRLVRPNESTYIKAGELHRLENEGKIPVVLIEAQVGEDDIVRVEDDFSRECKMLNIDKFKTLVDIAPLVSIDFIIKNSEDKILLGKRVNKPAWWKNEDEISKILIQSLLECLNKDSFVDDNISTHYVNLAYEINIQDLPNNTVIIFG